MHKQARPTQNHLHSGGQKIYKKELLHEAIEKIDEVKDSTESGNTKKNLITAIISKYRQLFKDSDHSLFLT